MQVSGLLAEERSETKPCSARENLKQKQQEVQQRELTKKKKAQELER